MVYQDVFLKWYGKPNKPEECRWRGRVPEHCPGREILKELLEPIYGPYLRLSECESSVSLTTRPDPLFSVLRQRAARQVYIFGKTGPFGDYEALVGALDVRCVSDSEWRDLQADPRWGPAFLCASGYLRPPMHMVTESGYVIPILDYYSSHEGILPFLCTPYISHHNFSGYLCAQAALSLGLEMSMPLGACPHSPATLSHMVSDIGDSVLTPPGWKPCLCGHDQETVNQNKENKSFADGYLCRGLTVSEMKAILSNTDCLNVNCMSFDASVIGSDSEIATALHIKAMLDSRMPVLAVVDMTKLSSRLGRIFYVDEIGAHVITIIGYRISGSQRDFRIVFHDGHLGPYRELPIADFIEASRRAPSEHGGPSERVQMFTPLPRQVSADVYKDVVRAALPYTRSGYKPRIRLCSVRQLNRYLALYAPGRLPSGLSEVIEWLTANALPGSASSPEAAAIWLVEYSHKKKGTFLDIINAQELDGSLRRLGVISLSHSPEKGPWVFVKSGKPIDCKFYHDIAEAANGEKKEIYPL